MRIYGVICLVTAVILLLAPLSALDFGHGTVTEKTSDASEVLTSDAADADTISVFRTEEDITETMPMRDYLIGVVAAEMPASYEPEALKAQALASATLARYMKKHRGDLPEGVDITDSSAVHQGFVSVDEMKAKWGDAFDDNYKKISEAVDAVKDKVIVYDGEPIMAAYHAISSGKTEDAANIWQGDVPYLKSVDSSGDRSSVRYSIDIKADKDKLYGIFGGTGVDFSLYGEDFITVNDTTDAGTVKSVTVGGKEYGGTEIRKLLGLRSQVFTVSYDEGEFVFNVKGYGHGVGMSQFGADYLAMNGYSCEEIIKHYYTGVEIVRLLS